MMTFSQMNRPRLSTVAALAAAFSAMPALADDHAALEGAGALESRVSGVVGADLYSHFVSYGFDVWAEGEPLSGAETFNPYAEISLDLGEFSVFTGLWGDINDNANDTLGNEIQEIDVYGGVSTSVDKLSIGVVYQEWAFAGQTEKILDINLGYDDSELWGDSGFSISPSVTIHNRIDNGLGLSNGTVLVLGAELPVDLGDSPLSLSVPIAVGFVFDEGYFQAGGDDGFGYFSVGLSAGYSLGDVIGPEYGDWALNAGITFFATEEGVYNNPEDSFLVLNVGISLAF